MSGLSDSSWRRLLLTNVFISFVTALMVVPLPFLTKWNDDVAYRVETSITHEGVHPFLPTSTWTYSTSCENPAEGDKYCGFIAQGEGLSAFMMMAVVMYGIDLFFMLLFSYPASRETHNRKRAMQWIIWFSWGVEFVMVACILLVGAVSTGVVYLDAFLPAAPRQVYWTDGMQHPSWFVDLPAWNQTAMDDACGGEITNLFYVVPWVWLLFPKVAHALAIVSMLIEIRKDRHEPQGFTSAV